MNKTKIIVVEDNIVYCEYVCNMLSREGYRNMKAYHLSTAKKHLQQATDNDIVVADLRLPDGSGIDLLCWMRKEGKMQPFIIMTDYAEVNTAVESMKLGSIDYIPKQLVEDKLVPLIRSILKERQAGQRRMPVFAREGSAFQKIMHRIRLVAATDMSVMIFGENGTGKEHIAHLLHDKSKRAGKPFVAVDCGSLSKELAPSAFFGHVKGAFTGADNAKKGYFHEAEGGTLFLDEVGNLALETQQMLLRAIQERRYRPVGDKADRNFNVRIIAATNEDLEVSVNEKRFRQDLLYRLHDFGITVPPLRDCQEDIMPLAEFFRDMANRELECSVSGFSSEARKALLTHAWPGNVRELRQKVMGAVLQAQEGVVMKEHLELAVTKPTSTVNFALRNDAEDKERILAHPINPGGRIFDSTENLYLCAMNNQGLLALAQLILPSEILTNFEVVRVEEEASLIRIYLDESVKAEYKENPEIESKGFCEAVTIRDFPIRDKGVDLIVRRRKWYDKQNNRYFSDSYELKAEGTRYSKEFAAFLKGVYGDDSYDLPFA